MMERRSACDLWFDLELQIVCVREDGPANAIKWTLMPLDGIAAGDSIEIEEAGSPPFEIIAGAFYRIDATFCPWASLRLHPETLALQETRNRRGRNPGDTSVRGAGRFTPPPRR